MQSEDHWLCLLSAPGEADCICLHAPIVTHLQFPVLLFTVQWHGIGVLLHRFIGVDAEPFMHAKLIEPPQVRFDVKRPPVSVQLKLNRANPLHLLKHQIPMCFMHDEMPFIDADGWFWWLSSLGHLVSRQRNDVFIHWKQWNLREAFQPRMTVSSFNPPFRSYLFLFIPTHKVRVHFQTVGKFFCHESWMRPPCWCSRLEETLIIAVFFASETPEEEKKKKESLLRN